LELQVLDMCDVNLLKSFMRIVLQLQLEKALVIYFRSVSYEL
ncbi:1831_t:CDS:1, partial [Acaulospora morrowiae]